MMIMMMMLMKNNTCSFTPVRLDTHWFNLTYGKLIFCDILDTLKNQIKPKEYKIYSRFSHCVKEFSDPWRAIWAHHLFWHHSGSSSTYWAMMMAIWRRGRTQGMRSRGLSPCDIVQWKEHKIWRQKVLIWSLTRWLYNCKTARTALRIKQILWLVNADVAFIK